MAELRLLLKEIAVFKIVHLNKFFFSLLNIDTLLFFPLIYYPGQEFLQNSAEYKKYICTNLQILQIKKNIIKYQIF
jgi:hypothetical protein